MVPCLVGLLWSPSSAEARDVRVIWQGVVRGGVSVDASGVAVPPNHDNSPHYGPDLVVQMPSTGRVEHVYALLTTRGQGLLPHTAAGIRVNGTPLTAAIDLGEVDDPQNRLRIYELPPNRFRIDGPGSYSYSESGKVENRRTHPGFGVCGTTLVVVYSDDAHYGRRHVSVLGTIVWLGTESLGGLPTGQAADTAVMSIAMGFEPWFDQYNHVWVNEVEITRRAGGADDGDAAEGYTRPLPNHDSLVTAGSFGFDEDGILVGTDGDEPDAEPVGGTINNSRRSDELYRVPLDPSGDLLFDLRSTNHMMDDQWITSVVLSVEVDTDEDGLEDAVDADLDGDGVDNAEEDALGTDPYARD